MTKEEIFHILLQEEIEDIKKEIIERYNDVEAILLAKGESTLFVENEFHDQDVVDITKDVLEAYNYVQYLCYVILKNSYEKVSYLKKSKLFFYTDIQKVDRLMLNIEDKVFGVHKFFIPYDTTLGESFFNLFSSGSEISLSSLTVSDVSIHSIDSLVNLNYYRSMSIRDFLKNLKSQCKEQYVEAKAEFDVLISNMEDYYYVEYIKGEKWLMFESLCYKYLYAQILENAREKRRTYRQRLVSQGYTVKKSHLTQWLTKEEVEMILAFNALDVEVDIQKNKMELYLDTLKLKQLNIKAYEGLEKIGVISEGSPSKLLISTDCLCPIPKIKIEVNVENDSAILRQDLDDTDWLIQLSPSIILNDAKALSLKEWRGDIKDYRSCFRWSSKYLYSKIRFVSLIESKLSIPLWLSIVGNRVDFAYFANKRVIKFIEEKLLLDDVGTLSFELDKVLLKLTQTGW